MYGLVVKFELRPGAGTEFDKLVEQTLEGIRGREPGTRLYLCHEVDGEPEARIFYELYEDEAAFRKHEDQPHVRRFLTGREGLLAGRSRVEFLRSGLGKGWPARTV
ncbi:MAG: antibiotic biosynthesis monooxygenase [Candidatus Dormibacteraeota bacterium]|nr:antibiotic biosynthesis monooxygenase [Candidatus Dormibacteraeota bacterium]